MKWNYEWGFGIVQIVLEMCISNSEVIIQLIELFPTNSNIQMVSTFDRE